MSKREVVLWCSALLPALVGCGAAIWGQMIVLVCCLSVSIILMTLSAAFLARSCVQVRQQNMQLKEELVRQAQEHQKTLLQTKQTAEEHCQKEIDQFRSNLSHSVRVPLSIVQGYAELLNGPLIQDETVRSEYLEKLVQRTKYIASLLGQHMSQARSEDPIALSPSHVDLLEMIRQTADDFQNSASLRGISIQVLSSQTAVELYADPGQLAKVFFNLVENSVKYMGREGMITIRLAQVGDQVDITVQDDGLGLEETETARIFEHSFQGSNRRGGHGHGHGLAMTRRIVEAHGGSISAESRPGQGMRIRITLPTGIEEPAAAVG